MGAYENPTQAIDRESGMIIANAIGRIGQQTSNYLQTYADARNKGLGNDPLQRTVYTQFLVQATEDDPH